MMIQRLDHCNDRTLQRHLRAGTPFVFTQTAHSWPAIRKWTPAYLACVCADRKIPVSYYPDGKRCASQKQLTLQEYLEVVQTQPGAADQYYMETNPLTDLSPDLYRDIPFPAFLDELPEREDMVFFGQNSGSCCHIHPHHEAICFQILGKKTFTLYHPRDARNLYLGPFYGDYRSSRMDFSALNLMRFPRARRLAAMDIELGPGDALFIPVQWAHWTRAQGLTFSLTRFFSSSLQRYHYPSPGLTCVLGRLYHKLIQETWFGRRLVLPFLR
jgi:hypothetical protein